MSLLLESIQILNGEIQLLDYHNERMNRSRNQLMCTLSEIFLEDYINIPKDFLNGKIKCRILYGQDIDKIEYTHYSEKVFTDFKLIETNIDYSFKYSDRAAFEKLKAPLPNTTEIILTKKGFITDSSFSNLIFKDKHGQWFTPVKTLLEGVQREFLLDEEMIMEREIKTSDLHNYTHFMLINAMLNFDESRALDISYINH